VPELAFESNGRALVVVPLVRAVMATCVAVLVPALGFVLLGHPPFLHWSLAVGGPPVPPLAGTWSTPLTKIFETSAVPWTSMMTAAFVIVPGRLQGRVDAEQIRSPGGLRVIVHR
jgi:hypothetical protein